MFYKKTVLAQGPRRSIVGGSAVTTAAAAAGQLPLCLGAFQRLQDRRRDEDAGAAAADRVKGGGAIVRVEQHRREAALKNRVVEAGERCHVLAQHFDRGAVGQLRRQLRRRRLQAEGPLGHRAREGRV